MRNGMETGWNGMETGWDGMEDKPKTGMKLAHPFYWKRLRWNEND